MPLKPADWDNQRPESISSDLGFFSRGSKEADRSTRPEKRGLCRQFDGLNLRNH
jgi:hypothetical protein